MKAMKEQAAPGRGGQGRNGRVAETFVYSAEALGSVPGRGHSGEAVKEEGGRHGERKR